ncbi:transposase (plasmid) [Burkholderia gladioli]|nr:transposase [Burkholderia gladioli]
MILDLSSVCAMGRAKTGPNSVDRARPNSKHHVSTDANGVPLSIILTGAHRRDVTQLLPLSDAIPPIPGNCKSPSQKSQVVYADRAYDPATHHQKLRDRDIKPDLSTRRTEHGSGLEKYQWVVKYAHAWFHNFHRLRVSYKRLAKIHEAFEVHRLPHLLESTLKRSIQPFGNGLLVIFECASETVSSIRGHSTSACASQ